MERIPSSGNTVSADFAKLKFFELLDRVERGQTFTITRNARDVASLLPAKEPAIDHTVFFQIRAMREHLSLGKGESAKDLIGIGR
jgi:prevent-host-death family protein